jgi:hypothetical protein
MLKSCVRPCEVLIANRHLSVIQSVVLRYAAHSTQRLQQLRHKSSKPNGQYSRWANKKSTHIATAPAAASVPKPASSKPSTKAGQEPQDLSGPKPRAQLDDVTGFRPLFIDSVKPTSNQDLASTRPADLEIVPPAQEDESGNVPITVRASYFYRLGKSYVTFYKTGVKNIWNNRKEYKKIKARLGPYNFEDAALYGGQAVNRSENSNEVNVEKIPMITRREYQLCLRTKHDLAKLIPFGIVFAICGEFTPLVILALGSSVVPYTCRIPKQQLHDRRWFEKRLAAHTPELVAKEEQKLEAGVFKPGPSWWNTLAFLHGVSPFAKMPSLIVQTWVLPRLRRRGLEVLADTALIRREGGFHALDPIEVYEYANKFFCLYLIMASKYDLHSSDNIVWPRSWVPDYSAALIDTLEDHATNMLAADWGRIPEPERWNLGLPINFDFLKRLRDMEKEFERTGKMPRPFKD